MTTQMHDDANAAWRLTLQRVMARGRPARPGSFAAAEAGGDTREVEGGVTTLDMMMPVVTQPERKPYFRFMAAEALWILSGDDGVAGVAPWAKDVAKFSDDGRTFFGAYGPPFKDQIPYVLQKLADDPATRQAVMTIWRQNPPATKDVPCTVAISFMVREGRLNLHVFMRSSDAWLGLPNDLFAFSMMGWHACACLNNVGVGGWGQEALLPGVLRVTAASSHLYARDLAAVRAALDAPCPPAGLPPALPPGGPLAAPAALREALLELRDGPRGAGRWWVAP